MFRYYWREIFFETAKRFAKWAEVNGYVDHQVARREQPNKHKEIEPQVADEIKVFHKRSPKYTYTEESSAEVLSRCGVEVLDLYAKYSLDEQGTREITTAVGTFGTPEEAATAHFRSLGFEVVFCESRPFHVLFGVYMWLLIQESADSLHRLMGFRDRAANGERQEGCLMKTASRTTKSRSSTAPDAVPRCPLCRTPLTVPTLRGYYNARIARDTP